MRYIEDLTEKEAVRCKTKEELEKILILSKSILNPDEWDKHGEATAFIPKKQQISHKYYIYDYDIIYDSKLF